MKYEYNGNLLEEERINLVANEIINKYPFISFEEARDAAMLEGNISDNKNIKMQFDRLYNIMLVLEDDRIRQKEIYVDMLHLIENDNGYGNVNYYTILFELGNYMMSKRDFPYLDEF